MNAAAIERHSDGTTGTRSAHRWTALRTAALTVALLAGRLEVAISQNARRADSATVTPAAEFSAGWLHRLLLGANYRRLWATPVEAPILDLDRFAGGLTPTKIGGGQQTPSLRFTAADGRRYTFRTIRKEPGRTLPPELRGTIVDDILVDQMSAGFPYGAVVVERLLDAAELPSTRPTLVVLPNSPRLGEFRAAYAGALGFIEERLVDGDAGSAGFGGYTSIVSTEELIARRRAKGEAVDAPAYLAARVLDLYVGDWDRHRDQWRWGRTGESAWRPLPRDRDQAFVRFDGVLLAAVRSTVAPQLVKFEPDDIPVDGLTWNGRDIDREILPRLEWATWDSVVTTVIARLTTQRIDHAVAALPAGAADEAGFLRSSLIARRDRLRPAIHQFYRRLARETELHATDRPERVMITGIGQGKVRLTVAGGSIGTRIVRTFDPKETEEVRLYLHDGADSVVVDGPSSSILVRLIDDRGQSQIVRSGGPEVDVHHDGLATRPNPTTRSAPPPRDWGSRSIPFPVLAAATDVGLVVGRGVHLIEYGFGKQPYASRLTLEGSLGTGTIRPGVRVAADVRTTNPAVRFRFDAEASGVDAMRYYGIGNETVQSADRAYHRILNWNVEVAPALELAPDRRLTMRIGPAVRFVDAEPDSSRLIGQEAPYGSAGFGLVAGRASITWDSRDVANYPRRGLLLSVTGQAAPATWDTEEAFGSVAGEARTYWSPADSGGPTLALRAGGARGFGKVPFFEAPSVGGPETIRGFAPDRFRGDGSVYGGAEVRLPVSAVRVFVPGTLGVVGFADAGRVFVDEETSSTWHTGFGGGLWLSWLGPNNTLSALVGKSTERTAFYLKLGMSY